MLYGLIAIALWHAPIYGWLLLVSGWARRATFLWAVLPLIAIQIFEKITFGTSYFASMLKHRLMGFAPHAFGFHGDGHPTIDSLAQLTPGRYLEQSRSLARAASRGGIPRCSSPLTPLSRTALMIN